MDHMDIDDIVDVPDTPDRLATQRINEENHRSSFPYNNPWQQKFSEESAKNEPMVIDGGKGKLPLHPPKPNSTSSSSSSRNANLFRKGVIEKNPSFQNCDTNNAANTQYSSGLVRPLSTSKSSSCQHDGLIDLTERDLHRPVSGNDSPSKVSENIRAEFKKRSGLANGSSSLHGLDNFPTSSFNNANENRNSVNGVGSSTVFGERMDFVGNNQKKPVSNGFLPRDSVASPKVNRQKRLVRNGCISPNNIAKAEKLSGKDVNGSVAVGCHNNGSGVSSALVIPDDLIRELVAEDSESYARKGKGVVNHPCSSKGFDIKNKNPHGRSYVGFNDNACKSTEEPSGWRSTRNRTAEINLLSPDKDQFSSHGHENRTERRGKATSVANGDNNYPKDTNITSSEHVSPQPARARLGRLNGARSVKDTVIKRQKQGSTPSTYGECSTSVTTDPEVVFLSSSQQAANSKSTSRSINNLQPIIEVDESSPELRRNNDREEEARKRQVEADERLARELQEQLYSELPAFGAAEMDENIALALQNQDDPSHGFSRAARQPVLDPRVSMSRSSSSNVARRGALARASTLGRMTRLRSRFPGQPRTVLPSRGRASIFPADMDVDMRMHILGALEELSGVEVSRGMLQSHRDFNENDYEMLLALDENNHRHSGASTHQINGLPQSTVQTDNFEEACAICLDTPTIGDTIRHLPCLHKFHKDCIDPWLKRKTSCPVCKSSLT